jgi:hypothetical protein
VLKVAGPPLALALFADAEGKLVVAGMDKEVLAVVSTALASALSDLNGWDAATTDALMPWIEDSTGKSVSQEQLDLMLEAMRRAYERVACTRRVGAGLKKCVTDFTRNRTQ